MTECKEGPVCAITKGGIFMKGQEGRKTDTSMDDHKECQNTFNFLPKMFQKAFKNCAYKSWLEENSIGHVNCKTPVTTNLQNDCNKKGR